MSTRLLKNATHQINVQHSANTSTDLSVHRIVPRRRGVLYAILLCTAICATPMLGAPAPTLGDTTSAERSEVAPYHPETAGEASAHPVSALKNDPTPPSEEDPEVDEIDPLSLPLRVLEAMLKRFGWRVSA